MRSLESSECRVEPLGIDESGYRYFYFGNPDWRICNL